MSGDNKSADNKDETFELLAHEKKISELYQNNKQQQAQQPSAQIDSRIMAMAKQQLSDNSSLLTKAATPDQQSSAHKKTQHKSQKSWQWPFSLVASVGILSVLFITQKDYFIHSNNIAAGDAGIINVPVIGVPDISEVEIFSEELVAVKSFPVNKAPASALKPEILLDKGFVTAQRKNMSVSQTSKLLNEQLSDSSMLEDNSLKTSPISLLDMSKLAELLKRHQTIQNISEVEATASSVKMQQTLFEHLTRYQKSHAEFIIPDKYLSVLTEKQVEQLTSFATETVPEN
jgi:hypothetical protein